MAPRSVATIFRICPSSMPFMILAAFTTGMGQRSPLASNTWSSLYAAMVLAPFVGQMKRVMWDFLASDSAAAAPPNSTPGRKSLCW